MAKSQEPRARTASTCTAATARGTHSFKIADYSLHKGLGFRKSIRSATFAVGGYDWCIRYYPNGDGPPEEGSKGNLVVFLELMTKDAKVRALVEFSLVDQLAGVASLVFHLENPKLFNSIDFGKNVWGLEIMSFRELEESPYLWDDCLVIECDVTVIKKPRVAETAVAPEIQLPPSCLFDNLGKLLETGDGADVTFKVQGEVFPAHKIILAMHSLVFKAELYGLMRDMSEQSITVKDMEPAVFKGLLLFIYTDSLPSMDDLEGMIRKQWLSTYLWLRIGMASKG